MAALKRRYAPNILLGVAGTLLLLSGGARADSVAATDSVEAVWKSHGLTFEYRGYNTVYTCDGLRGKLTKVLLNLGARSAPTLSAYLRRSIGFARFQVRSTHRSRRPRTTSAPSRPTTAAKCSSRA